MPTFTDGVLLGACVLVLDFLVWRLAAKGTWRRFVSRTVLFVILTYLLFSSGMSPFAPAPWPDERVRHVLGQLLELVWWLQGAQLATVLLDRLILPETWHRERLFQDVLGALVFVAAAVAATAYVLELPVQGLLATSGAVAIILGLAIQSSLSDVFSGVVLNATEPFHLGDWVVIGDVEGQVVGSNWRATRLLNGEGNIVVVPNSVAAKGNIINNSEPSHMHGVSVRLEVGPEVEPSRVLEGLKDATAGASGVLDSPRPVANVKRATPNAIEYEIVCYVDALEKKADTRNALFDLAHRHLASRGIALSSQTAPGPLRPDVPYREQLLRRVTMFQTLSDKDFSMLADAMTQHEFDAGEIVYASAEGIDGKSLHIIAMGAAKVMLPRDGQLLELRRMGPGESIGQSGILAGVKFNVNVQALTHVTVFRLSKDALTPILKERPEVGRQMCRLLTRHHTIEESLLTGILAPVQEETGLLQWFRDGMRRLHDLAS
jgi:small-conductance mechanosensitive channel